MKATVIGLTGKARSGKDTAARFILKELSRDTKHVYRMGMADTLKSMLVVLLNVINPEDADKRPPLPHLMMEDSKETPIESIGKSPRQLLQTLGTDWGRKMIHPNLWVTVMRNKIGFLMSYADDDIYVVIPDIRYDNEAVLLCDYLFRVEREDAPDVNEHVSESGLSDDVEITGVIPNNGSLDDLRYHVRRIINEEVRAHERPTRYTGT